MSPKVARIFALFQQDRLAARITAVTLANRTGQRRLNLTIFPAVGHRINILRVPYHRRSVCFALSGVSGAGPSPANIFWMEFKNPPPNGVESPSVSQPR